MTTQNTKYTVFVFVHAFFIRISVGICFVLYLNCRRGCPLCYGRISFFCCCFGCFQWPRIINVCWKINEMRFFFTCWVIVVSWLYYFKQVKVSLQENILRCAKERDSAEEYIKSKEKHGEMILLQRLGVSVRGGKRMQRGWTMSIG